jgi:hypothetical protein
MRSFMRLSASLLFLCLVIFTFAYFVGPQSIRQSFRNPESPVGQLKENAELKSPGQPAESK